MLECVEAEEGAGGDVQALGGDGEPSMEGDHDSSSSSEEEVVQENTEVDNLYIFEWENADQLQLPHIPRFTARPGVLAETENFNKPSNYFKYFLNDDIMNIMVEQTNIFAQQFLVNNPNLPPHSPARECMVSSHQPRI